MLFSFVVSLILTEQFKLFFKQKINNINIKLVVSHCINFSAQAHTLIIAQTLPLLCQVCFFPMMVIS